jgi:hypothetical protein
MAVGSVGGLRWGERWVLETLKHVWGFVIPQRRRAETGIFSLHHGPPRKLIRAPDRYNWQPKHQAHASGPCGNPKPQEGMAP